MGKYLPPPDGLIEINDYYAGEDNAPAVREVKFAIPYGKWSEFVESPICQQLVEYVEGLASQQIQDTHTEPSEQEYISETEELSPHSMPEDHYESFWARVRRLFRGK